MGKCINRRRNGDKEVKQQVMEMTRLTACGLFVGLALSACQPNTGENEGSEHTVVVDTLAYVYEDYIKYSEHLIKTSETTDTTFFAASFPVFDDSVANRFVQTALLGDDSTTVEEAANTFIGEFDRFYASDPYPRIWPSESHAEVYSNPP